MGPANCRKKQGNQLVYNQDSNAHLIQLQKTIIVKVELRVKPN